MDSLSQISEEQSFTAISEPDFESRRGRGAGRRPDDVRVRHRSAARVRHAASGRASSSSGRCASSPTPTSTSSSSRCSPATASWCRSKARRRRATTSPSTSRTTADGKQVAHEEERSLRIRPTLSFRDGQIEGFDKLMAGVKAGDKRTGKVELTARRPERRAPRQEGRSRVRSARSQEAQAAGADRRVPAGNGRLRDRRGAPRRDSQRTCERQLEYEQQRKARQQITAELTKKADWELPPGLLKRQSVRELERAVMELRRGGFSEAEIRARENELRQNSAASTATALKEHFILERIAEEEKIDAEEGDYEKEIFLIAMQSGESPRRVRAQLEKRGLMDVLRNQIVERKVLERGAGRSQVQGRAVRADEGRRGSDLDGGRRRRRRPFPRPRKRPKPKRSDASAEPMSSLVSRGRAASRSRMPRAARSLTVQRRLAATRLRSR